MRCDFVLAPVVFALRMHHKRPILNGVIKGACGAFRLQKVAVLLFKHRSVSVVAVASEHKNVIKRQVTIMISLPQMRVRWGAQVAGLGCCALLLSACMAQPSPTESSSSTPASQSSSAASVQSSATTTSSASSVAATPELTGPLDCSTVSVDTGEKLWGEKCAACHQPFSNTGIAEGGVGGTNRLSADQVTFTFQGNTHPADELHIFITESMAAFGNGCDAQCGKNIALYIKSLSSSPWCVDPSTTAPKATIFKLVAGTDIEAPVTDCRTLNPTPDALLSKAQYSNAVHAIFKPLVLEIDTQLEALEDTSIVDGLTDTRLARMVELADAVAAQVSNQLGQLGLNCDGNRACAKRFVETFGRRAYRRPLTGEEVAGLLANMYDSEGGFSAGIAQLTRGLLLSAQTLYRYEVGVAALGGVEVLSLSDKATKLSLLLWNSIPDDLLLDAVDDGSFATEAGFRQQVERMIAETRFISAASEFHHHWLQLEGEDNPALHSGLIELDKMVAAIFREGGSYSDLMTTHQGFADATLASVYGVLGSVDTSNPMVPAGDQCNTTAQCRDIFGPNASDCKNSAANNSVCYCGNQPCAGAAPVGGAPGVFEAVTLNNRPGILTRAAFLAGSSEDEVLTSPPVRGKVLARKVMCIEVDDPPADVQDMFMTLPRDPNLTTRQEAELVVEGKEGCFDCHSIIDPLAFPLENFDGSGRYRTIEDGIMIDPIVNNSVIGPIAGHIDFAQTIATSEQAMNCYAEHWFTYAFLEDRLSGANSCVANDLKAKFKAKNGDLIELITELVNNPALHYRSL